MADAFPQQRKSKKQHKKKRKYNPYRKGGPLRTAKKNQEGNKKVKKKK